MSSRCRSDFALMMPFAFKRVQSSFPARSKPAYRTMAFFSRTRCLFCGTVFICLPSIAHAAPENIIVTATRLAGEQAGSNVSVIDQNTIQARNPGSVVDLLRDF